MKYERLTERKEDGDWHLVDDTIWGAFNAIDRLAGLEDENAELRARLKKAVELENKINNGELVDAIWFKSWVNGQTCCGSVIGYSDGCFVIACGDDLISANKIYTSREQARYELDKKIDKKEE